jgi:hypothetical protein
MFRKCADGMLQPENETWNRTAESGRVRRLEARLKLARVDEEKDVLTGANGSGLKE